VFRHALADAAVPASMAAILAVILAVSGIEVLPRLLQNQLADVRLPESAMDWMTMPVLAAYVVAQRRREFGIRLALGATRAQIYAAVLRFGIPPLLAGIAAGGAGAVLAARLLRSLLFEVTPYDPVTFASVPVAFFAATTLPMLMAAHRAASLTPVVALKHE